MTNANDRHLTQLNIGRLRRSTDDPRVADVMNNLEDEQTA
jgi:hypothetical protein